MTPLEAVGALVFAPLGAAVLAFLWPSQARRTAIGVCPILLVAAGLAAEARLAFGWVETAVGRHETPLGIALRLDGLSATMLLLTAVLATLITAYSQTLMGSADPRAPRTRYFWPLWLFLIAALNALFLSRDLFNLYVTLEILGFAAVGLVAIADHPAARNAAMRYLFVSLAGSLFYLLGVGLVYGATSTVDIALLATRESSGPALPIALALMTGGLLMKGALFPLHFWLPPAHATAPAPVSAVLSGLVVKGSIVILVRLYFEAFPGLASDAAMTALGVLGACAVLWGSVRALFSEKLKRLIAYSTVAQIGYIFLLFPLSRTSAPQTAITGALVFLVAHAIAKSAMFLSAGNIVHFLGHDRIRGLDGITRHLPLSLSAFALAGVSLVGLPPSAGFVGKWLLIRAALADGAWWWIVVIASGSLMASGYVLRVIGHAFTLTPEDLDPDAPPVERPRTVSWTMEWTCLVLAVSAIALGVFASQLAELLPAATPIALARGLGS